VEMSEFNTASGTRGFPFVGGPDHAANGGKVALNPALITI
jgi:hypothetical protein